MHVPSLSIEWKLSDIVSRTVSINRLIMIDLRSQLFALAGIRQGHLLLRGIKKADFERIGFTKFKIGVEFFFTASEVRDVDKASHPFFD